MRLFLACLMAAGFAVILIRIIRDALHTCDGLAALTMGYRPEDDP